MRKMGDRFYHSARHPAHLKGRDIGMFYRNRKRILGPGTSKSYLQLGPSVSLSDGKIAEIREFINLPVSASHSNLNQETLNNLIHDESIESEFKNKFLKINAISFEKQLAENISNIYLNNEEVVASNVVSDESDIDSGEGEKYEKMMQYRKTLPSYNHQKEIIDLVEANQIILISGDTGCGKTTQVSQYLLDHFIKVGKVAKCKIVCTQPRRISAITIAERVAEERLEHLGTSVGYQIRLNSVLPKSKTGTILYCTAGILLKIMENDKALGNITHLILDEIHERDIVSDLSIGIIKKILPYRKDLKLILMSATLRAEMFSKYFDNCPMITIEGRTYPVDEVYLEDVLEEIKFNKFPSSTANQKGLPIWVRKKNSKKCKTQNELQLILEQYARSLRGKYSDFVINTIMNPETENINIDLIEALIFNICQNKPPGSILVFLPGYDKISKLHKQMEASTRYPKTRFTIFALHSMMPSVDQKQVFYPAPEGTRKIIIATNIAETSITINDVVYVIDSGKRKLTKFDADINIQTLEEQWVSVANSAQRRGRAGRVQPGVCYHLYTKGRLRLLDEYPVPEILCTRLENTILTIKILCLGNTSEFLSTLIDVPDPAVIDSSIKLLRRLNALDENENLTPLGLHLAQLPLDPQIGKMILLGAIFSCIDPITTVAASLSFKDPFFKPLGKQEEVDRIRCNFAKNSRSDHLAVVNVFKEWRTAKSEHNENGFCYNNFLSISILNQLEQMKKQFCEHLSSTKFLVSSNPRDPGNNLNVDNSKVLKAIIGGGLFPNIARIKNVKFMRRKGFIRILAFTEEDGKVQIHPSSVNAQQSSFDSNYLVYHMKQKTSNIFLYDTTMVTPWSLLFFGDMLKTGMENGKSYISVANLYFECNLVTINLIKDLRDGLNLLLQKKLCKPSAISWTSDEALLLTAIMHLVSIDKKLEFSDDYDDEDDN